MTLWIAHEPRGPGIDLTTLYDYANGAEVNFIYSRSFNPGQHPQEALAVAETFASRFDFSKDFFVLAGGDPLAGLICMAALVHEAIDLEEPTVRSLRYIRDRDDTGERTIPRYVEVGIPTGVKAHHKGAA